MEDETVVATFVVVMRRGNARGTKGLTAHEAWVNMGGRAHAACGFPTLRVPAHFASRFMRPNHTGAAFGRGRGSGSGATAVPSRADSIAPALDPTPCIETCCTCPDRK